MYIECHTFRIEAAASALQTGSADWSDKIIFEILFLPLLEHLINSISLERCGKIMIQKFSA